jgi:alkyl hydroperoxide reductase subunit AhpC
MSLVGKKAPQFTNNAVTGDGEFKTISLSDYTGKWVVLFFYPLDFTFVCPTEIVEFSRRAAEFRDLKAEVIGCSVDSKYSHKAWINGSLGKLSYPLLADFNKDVASAYGCLDEQEGFAVRGTFIIDPQGVIRYAAYNAPGIGRSVSEVLRLLQAAQTGEKCPVEWKPGQPTLG